MIATLYKMTEGSLPLIGVGGIFTAEDAWEMISAGAILLQIYTGFIYEGPSIARKINVRTTSNYFSSKGFVSLDEAVGSRAKDRGLMRLCRYSPGYLNAEKEVKRDGTCREKQINRCA
jgi:dihydroorotate dehydrogenase